MAKKECITTLYLDRRELTVLNCCINIEIKTLEMEKIRLEDRVDFLAKMNLDCKKENGRLDIIEERLPELYELAKKVEAAEKCSKWI